MPRRTKPFVNVDKKDKPKPKRGESTAVKRRVFGQPARATAKNIRQLLRRPSAR